MRIYLKISLKELQISAIHCKYLQTWIKCESLALLINWSRRSC